MKKIILTLGVTLAMAAHASAANIVCDGKDSSLGFNVRVEIGDESVVVTGGLLNAPHIFTNLTKVNGLITAPGLAVHYKNNFGCIVNATIITETQEPFGAGYMNAINIDRCSGGSTPDSVCGIR